MDSLWSPFGFPLGSLWTASGFLLRFLEIPFGFSLDGLWTASGFPGTSFGFSLDSLQAPIGISWNYVAFTKNVPGKGSTINQAFFELLEMLVISSLAKNRLGVGELSPRNISLTSRESVLDSTWSPPSGLQLASHVWPLQGLH